VSGSRIAVYVALATLAAAVVFVAYALSGGDVCLWCRGQG
jgi:hypothetical protein